MPFSQKASEYFAAEAKGIFLSLYGDTPKSSADFETPSVQLTRPCLIGSSAGAGG